MAEIEIVILNRQGLNRRLEAKDVRHAEATAWEAERNTKKAKVHWTFTIAAARVKMKNQYPSIKV
jgi:hypothetical protein